MYWEYFSSKTVACLFIFQMVSFDEQTYLNLMKSSLSMFSFIASVFYDLRNFASCKFAKTYSHVFLRSFKIVVFEWFIFNLNFFFFSFFCFLIFRAVLAAYGSSQARDWIRAVAAGLHHSHSNARSELCLWPTAQLTATLDPSPTERGQGSNPHPHGD